MHPHSCREAAKKSNIGDKIKKETFRLEDVTISYVEQTSLPEMLFL